MTIIRRTPRGVRGLKCPAAPRGSWHRGRTPRGVRGLKSNDMKHIHTHAIGSHPSRGAWIEI